MPGTDLVVRVDVVNQREINLEGVVQWRKVIFWKSAVSEMMR